MIWTTATVTLAAFSLLCSAGLYSGPSLREVCADAQDFIHSNGRDLAHLALQGVGAVLVCSALLAGLLISPMGGLATAFLGALALFALASAVDLSATSAPDDTPLAFEESTVALDGSMHTPELDVATATIVGAIFGSTVLIEGPSAGVAVVVAFGVALFVLATLRAFAWLDGFTAQSARDKSFKENA